MSRESLPSMSKGSLSTGISRSAAYECSMASYYKPTLLEKLKYYLRKLIGVERNYIKTKGLPKYATAYHKTAIRMQRDILKSDKLGKRSKFFGDADAIDRIIAKQKKEREIERRARLKEYLEVEREVARESGENRPEYYAPNKGSVWGGESSHYKSSSSRNPGGRTVDSFFDTHQQNAFFDSTFDRASSYSSSSSSGFGSGSDSSSSSGGSDSGGSCD